ncbi:hypothetical protein BDW02DRAFT_636519 [Decorospora gaudefroyi]|uniref:Uncharacterized protein n=1 Tax=Decorospora gaudefroyi TaxID=184978 RepID=A0A6A5KSL8_9PLEO|nr:hypothetical protein BDW02DRAFT_636519 [Decorospora gaudefroyi]
MDPPPSATATYTALHTIALSFIRAQALDPSLATRMNFSLLRSFCSPSFQHSWGHNYAVSLSPPLQGTLSFEDFVTHLQSMLPRLESWKTDVGDVFVDEARMKVVVRISFWMRAKGEEVENDLVWILGMEKDGSDQAMRICRSEEFVDGVAAKRLREIMMEKLQT